jgi:hypothetical protein
MRFSSRSGILLVTVLLCSAAPQLGRSQTTPTPAEKGTAIGQVIASAIDTALPGIRSLATSILSIFHPAAPQGASAAAQQTQQSTQLKAALNTAVKSIEDSVKSKISGVGPLANQLDVFGPFLQYGFRASNDLAKLSAEVAAHPHPTSSEWDVITADWAEVNGSLNQLTDANLSSIQSDNIRTMLSDVIEAKNTTARAIQVYVDSGTAGSSDANLARELSELAKTLATIHVAARIQLQDLSDQIHTLVNWSNNLGPAQGGGTRPLPSGLTQDIQTATAILQQAGRK